MGDLKKPNRLCGAAPKEEEMAEDSLLSELCAICHANPLKYKCPRCAIQTCSLACVKRHKLWSQCSGTRDPAAYRKRSELGTPASIDQDYNFITSVERSLQKADDNAAGRGIDLEDEGRRTFVKGQSKLNMEIAKSGAIVLKAPAGLSRSKQNKTHWDNKRGCLLWTIEWILPDNTKVLGNTQATKTIETAFSHAVGRKALQSKRKMYQVEEKAQDQQRFHKKTKPDTLKQERERSAEATAPQAYELDKAKIGSDTPAEKEASRERNIAEPATSNTMANLISGLHFYLHCPNTPSNFKSLIPIKIDMKIEDIVQDRLLLEFPTIFIRTETAEHLPEPFILETEYTKKYGDEPAPVPLVDGRTQRDDNEKQMASYLDEKKLLEVLQKDLIS